MGWKQLEFKERLSMMTAGLQAVSTFGMLVVALIGIWKVAPIITYQLQQQETEIAQTDLLADPDTDPLVVDALAWWTEQLRDYRQVVELTGESGQDGREVSFEILTGGGTAIARGVRPDLLVVTAIGPEGQEVVSVPVNESAMSPSQYVRFRVNQGAFANLPADERRKVETAVERYINRVMVPKVPPILLRSDMSLEELRSEVGANRHHREEALRHIRGLQEVLAAAKPSQ